MGRRCSRDIAVGLVLCAEVIVSTCCGASFDETQAGLRASHPDGLSLTLRLDKDAFRIGERVGVTLDYENTSETPYRVSTRAYDRSGRLIDIQFHADGPQGGFADPLALYFATHGGIGGGLGSVATLGHYSQRLDLNEWIRFDQPGTYRVYCTTSRVTNVGGPSRLIPLCSQIVTINIVRPDEAWVAEQVASATAGLKSTQPEERVQAARTLRFLDQPQTMGTLVSLLSETDLRTDAFFGLVGTREPSLARQALLENIAKPDVVVDDRYFLALTIVSATPDGPTLTYDADREAFLRQGESLRAAQQVATEAAAKKLSEAIASKRGQAKPVSCLTLLHEDVNSPDLRKMLAETFTQLPQIEQRNVLGYQWEQVRCPAFQNTLENILSQPARREPWNSPQVRSWALLRYLEMQPERARELVLEDMRRARPMLAGEVLLALPNETLPHMDDAFARHLADPEADTEKLMGLIERYATRRILPEVIGVYRQHEGRWACDIQEYALGYWIKHDPENGLEAIRRAALLRARTKCYRSVLRDVLSRYYSPAAERLAVSFLGDSDNDVAVNVVRLLSKQASAAVIDPLLTRLADLDPKAEPDPASGMFTEGAVRSEIVSCLLKRRDWQWTDGQKKTLYRLLGNDNDRARFARRFPDLPGIPAP